ncbi:hypothetical protein AALP_AA6G120600 [Arabis alpina]|uniref:Uncharacterized protein n=1 Tax=Arabis alpina TaxID=50452 RepID=A0A087GNP9_ARAAL|nr:hypothetical protein AALP_AA6G120600 [Arabis alpina]
MFKSKPCNNNHHHHDINTSPYMHYNCNTSSPFSSDRVPDPKPRWNPKPEQIRILESIFNSEFGFGGDFALPVVTEQGMGFPAVNNGFNLEMPEINFDGGVSGGYSSISVPVTVPLTINQSQVLSGDEDSRTCVSPVRLTVFINDMPFEVVDGLFNVRQAFGNDAVLITSSGQPILTDEFGVTFQPLQNGAVYYLI